MVVLVTIDGYYPVPRASFLSFQTRAIDALVSAVCSNGRLRASPCFQDLHFTGVIGVLIWSFFEPQDQG